MYSFCLIGGGWRAEFYARVAQLLPDRFTLLGSWMRSAEKLDVWVKRFGGRALSEPADAALLKPDFIITSLPAKVQAEMLPALLDTGIPLLLETPLSWELEGLGEIKALAKGREHLINTAEQYLEWPLYRAWDEIVNEGLIGEVTSITANAIHGYHAASVIRHFLGTGHEKCRMSGMRFTYPITKTGGRPGILTGGEMTEYTRDIVTLQFESGKTALYDFSGEMYHSTVRSRNMIIQGTRGEISWDTVRYLSEDNLPLRSKIESHTLGINDNSFLALWSMTLGDRVLYRNPYWNARMNDDEIAVASLMEKMGKAAKGVIPAAYSFEESLRDAELACLMTQAATNPFTEVRG